MTQDSRRPLDYPEALHPTWMEVDLAALESNFREVRRLVGPETKIIASVKGNGYGLGVAEAARVLQRLGAYAVATGSFKDALAIRRAGIGIKVQMFPGNLPQGIAELLRHDLIPSVCNLETARAVSEAAEKPAQVFIKVDCGLARLGVPVDEAEDFVRAVTALPNIIVEGLFTHLPFGDAAGLDWARSRLDRFDDLIEGLKRSGIEIPVTQSLASSGVACRLRTACNTVCTGHLLYGGLARVPPELGDLSGFRPVLKAVRSRLIHIEQHPTDKAIGSGGALSLKAGSTTGVVPFGLYDGYRPAVSGQSAAMLVRGRRVPVLYVTQEYATLDLSAVADAGLGDQVTALGTDGAEDITIEEMAKWFGGIPLNVLMSLNERLPYRYFGEAGESAPRDDLYAVAVT
ncbi:MAG: alanine racemase [Rhodospirillales bacterium]|jgi:alanine racemase|nr:alanine racemase [Rhodospirillales bacterium]